MYRHEGEQTEERLWCPPKRVTFIELHFEGPPGMPAAVPEGSLKRGFAPRTLQLDRGYVDDDGFWHVEILRRSPDALADQGFRRSFPLQGAVQVCDLDRHSIKEPGVDATYHVPSARGTGFQQRLKLDFLT